VKATLIADGGAAASEDDNFFRSAPFLEAEAATHTIEIDGALRLPVIVRPIDGGDRVDAISPYGYPGASGRYEEPIDPGRIDWSETGLVSVFVRDRIGDQCLAGGTLRNHVHIAEGDSGIRKRLREQIRRNERRGWEAQVIGGPDADQAARSAFERAYAETMARTGAAERYLYPSEYFERLLRSERSWLVLGAREGVQLAGAIAVASDGYLHYFLGGTADEALGDSPMKNLFAAMISLGAELGLPASLGGGLTPGDSLDEFKRGFANGEAPFHTHELVCDPAAYEELVASSGPAPEGFFPAYRY
jgi:Acetyltransferase (GNAT) domain